MDETEVLERTVTTDIECGVEESKKRMEPKIREQTKAVDAEEDCGV